MISFKEFISTNEASKDVETLVVEVLTKIEQLHDKIFEYSKTPERDALLDATVNYSEFLEKNIKKLKGDK